MVYPWTSVRLGNNNSYDHLWHHPSGCRYCSRASNQLEEFERIYFATKLGSGIIHSAAHNLHLCSDDCQETVTFEAHPEINGVQRTERPSLFAGSLSEYCRQENLCLIRDFDIPDGTSAQLREEFLTAPIRYIDTLVTLNIYPFQVSLFPFLCFRDRIEIVNVHDEYTVILKKEESPLQRFLCYETHDMTCDFFVGFNVTGTRRDFSHGFGTYVYNLLAECETDNF